MNRFLALAVLIFTVLTTGCDSPQRTADTLREQIAGFKASPSAEKQEAIEANFIKLDSQIAKVREGGDVAKANSLQAEAGNLRADFTAAKLVSVIDGAREAIEGVGTSFKEAGETIGGALKEAFQGGSPTPTPQP